MATEKVKNSDKEHGLLATAAAAIGEAAGTLVALATPGHAGKGPAAAATPAPKSVKIPKLAPKNRSRLPRRQKKALAKQRTAVKHS